MDEIQAHLPEEPNSFIGRERELVELRRVLRQTRALTLCGPGGIGKTRLALRLLAAAAAEFPDGVWFVELADLRQPDLVVSRIAAVLGITEEAAGRCSRRSARRCGRGCCCWPWTTASTCSTCAPRSAGTCWPARRGCGW